MEKMCWCIYIYVYFAEDLLPWVREAFGEDFVEAAVPGRQAWDSGWLHKARQLHGPPGGPVQTV